jgi:CDP-glycerol glycerophosphotransferase (TagB/SpsB family)
VKLDYFLKNYHKQINGPKNSILIAPTEVEGFPELSIKNKLKKIIEILILNTKKNIILRPHPRNKNNILFNELKDNFSKNERFFYDDSENYADTYTKSELMITDMSGTAYTFAYINLCPVIFFSNSEKYLQENNYTDYKFYLNRKKIGKIIFNENELIKTIDDLNKDKEKYKNQILELRNEMKYLNKSTKKLINFFNDLN